MKNWCEIRTVCDNEAIESRRLCGDPLKIQATEGNAHKTFVIFVILNAVLWIRNDKSGSSYDILEFQIQTLPILFRNNRNYWEKKIKFNQKEETTNYKPFSSSHGSTVQCTLYSTEFTHLKLEEFFFIHLLFHVLLDPTEHQLNTITFYGKCAQCYALNTGFAIHITHAK